MNYELLGQGDNIHMHWHFFPRRKGDTPVPGPVWKLPKEEMYADKYLPSDSELQEMKQKLNTELENCYRQNNLINNNLIHNNIRKPSSIRHH